MPNQEGIKVVSKNKRAAFDFELLDKFEAGMSLQGTEIKSIRATQVNLRRSSVQNRNGEGWLLDGHISP
jgi:SsrA-binding protein